MNKTPSSITINCLFCGMVLQVPENSAYSSGDMIKCQECGEQNDYDSLIEVAKHKGIQHIKGPFTNEIKKIFDKNRRRP